jgi:hypothetical protein
VSSVAFGNAPMEAIGYGHLPNQDEVAEPLEGLQQDQETQRAVELRATRSAKAISSCRGVDVGWMW